MIGAGLTPIRHDCSFITLTINSKGTDVNCAIKGKKYRGCVDCKDFDKLINVTDLVKSLVKENAQPKQQLSDEIVIAEGVVWFTESSVIVGNTVIADTGMTMGAYDEFRKHEGKNIKLKIEVLDNI